MPKKKGAEKQLRLDYLAALKAKGYTQSEINKIVGKKWKLSERHLKRYWAELRKNQNALANQSDNDYFAQAISRNDYLYRQAVHDKNIPMALKLEEQRLKLFEAQKKRKGADHDTVSNRFEISQDELDAIHAALNRSNGQTESAAD